MRQTPFTTDVAIIGGCGRVGLPLGLAFASRGLSVALFDIDRTAVETVSSGRMPFHEDGAGELLTSVCRTGLLRATVDPAVVTGSENVVVVVGTPLDRHLNPDPDAVPRALEQCAPCLSSDQLVVLRSTVHPGGTALTERLLAKLGLPDIDVAFCPERIAEGRALIELFDLPQIVSAHSPRALSRAEKLFRHLTGEIVPLSPEEAELAKLLTNTWRYIKFATANQFWMMANDLGLDYERIRHAIRHDYPRAADLSGAGFTAGPCLLKDTMQLAAFSNNTFVLGHAAMLVNEGLPLYLVTQLEKRYDLPNLRVGILGMAFKGDSDDPRESLSYKLRKILTVKAARVLCTDPHIGDARFLPLDQVLAEADVLIVAAPHSQYRSLTTDKPIVDIWGLTGRSVLV